MPAKIIFSFNFLSSLENMQITAQREIRANKSILERVYPAITLNLNEVY
jgi:hypothetical protein